MDSHCSSYDSTVRMDIVGKVPVEISWVILSYLNVKDLYRCFRVSRRWRALANSEHLWSRALPFASYFPSATDFKECDSDGVVVCPTMRKYVADLAAMKRWGRNEPRWTRSIEKWKGHKSFINSVACNVMDKNHVWIPSQRRSGIGDIVELNYPIPSQTMVKEYYLLCSEDTLYLACTANNLTYLYSRSSPLSNHFFLRDILCSHFEENFIINDDGSYRLRDRNGDDQRLMSAWREGSCGMSLEEFFDKHHSKDWLMKCELFTGVNDERILCFTDFCMRGLLVWNVSRCRVVAYLLLDEDIWHVQPGWEGRGLCISLLNRIICYDCEGQIINTFVVPTDHILHDALLMRSISVVFAAVEKESELMLWEFRPNDSKAKITFNIQRKKTLKQVKLLGGPAYPVLIATDALSLQIYIGLVNTHGVCTWQVHQMKRNYSKFYFEYCNLVQFVNGSSYILLCGHKEDWYTPRCQLLKVNMNSSKEGSKEKPDIVLVEFCDEPDCVFWVDSTRLALSLNNSLIIKAFI